jgi:ribosome-associated protein
MNDTAAKKDVQKLQRAVVDSLEDVKAQDLVVFDTEHISSLFERVIIASGTSNRQTKALAASVRDKVREAGFAKPRIEGEDNGEWIIVDCGAVVVHIMQPTIRQYYNLEEIWGEKPIRSKLGAAKPAAPKAVATKDLSKSPKTTAKKTTKSARPAAKSSGAPAKRLAEAQPPLLQKKQHLKLLLAKPVLKKHLLKRPLRVRNEAMGRCRGPTRSSLGPNSLGRLRQTLSCRNAG